MTFHFVGRCPTNRTSQGVPGNFHANRKLLQNEKFKFLKKFLFKSKTSSDRTGQLLPGVGVSGAEGILGGYGPVLYSDLITVILIYTCVKIQRRVCPQNQFYSCQFKIIKVIYLCLPMVSL